MVRSITCGECEEEGMPEESKEDPGGINGGLGGKKVASVRMPELG